jgi:pimeloyl-ACP methyl ester carboxylesterase
MARRPSPFALVLLLLTGLLVACSDDDDAPAITGTPAPTTTTIPFAVVGGDLYSPPVPLPAGSHGDLIWAEDVGTWWGSPRRAWRVLYLSTAVDGHAVAVSGVVIAPPLGANGDAATDLPVIAWAHETVGSADTCAPSRTFVGERRTDEPGRAVEAQLTDLVDSGHVVVATDYEGLGTPGPHPFLVGESEGRSVLDAVLAAQDLPDSGAGAEVLVYGASQGGQAALWAGQLAPAWSPGLDVLGVVAAAPFSEVDLLLPAATAIPGGEGYVVLGAYGQVAANPALSAADVLEPEAVASAAVIEEACLIDVAVQLHDLAVATRRPVGRLDGFARPDWKAQLQSIKPGQSPVAAPTLVVQGARDIVVPVQTTNALVARLCGLGDTVRTIRYASAGHADVVVSADADVRTWIDDRLAGRPAPSDC